MQSAGSVITYSRRKRHLIDRLSALPDDIICRILFFLETRESVATSILARRWRFLWAYVPKLYFGVDMFYLRTGFSKIVNTVMPLHKLQSLEVFGICEDIKSGISEYQLESWITTAIDLNVQLLDLYFDPQRSFKLPQCLFSCKTVVDMSLFRCGGIPLVSSGGAIHFPNLKKLFLEDVDYELEEALPRLLSGCPVLEELTVVGMGPLSGCLNISSPTVKTLMLNHESRTDIFDPNDRVLINAPALIYLKIGCRDDNILFSSITTSLVEVVMELKTYMFEALDYSYARHQVLKFLLDGFRNIKKLKVINNIKEIIEFGVVDSNVRFENLVKLDLTADSQFLSKFIGRANDLGVFGIHKGYECLKTLMEPVEEECACPLHSFRNVTIHQFRGTEQELYAVEYILRNARVLERMEIYSRHDDTLGPKRDLFRKISLFHRVSKECEISFS